MREMLKQLWMVPEQSISGHTSYSVESRKTLQGKIAAFCFLLSEKPFQSTHSSLVCSPERFLLGTQELLFPKQLHQTAFVSVLCKTVARQDNTAQTVSTGGCLQGCSLKGQERGGRRLNTKDSVTWSQGSDPTQGGREPLVVRC